MKNTHLKTPRTMGECEFSLNADPIERPEPARFALGAVYVIAFAVLALVLFGVIA